MTSAFVESLKTPNCSDDEMRVGILHPGEMGAVVGRLLTESGHQVYWVRSGRSAETANRAAAARLHPLDAFKAITRRAQVLFSICPPESALDVAKDVAEAGFTGVFVDANAVSPETARRIASLVENAGASFVDGGLVGPPPHQSGSTRLYLSGECAHQAQTLFKDTHLEAIEVAGGIGAASAVKMCYAAWTKGSAALILSIRALARAEGVDAPLLSEWQRSQPSLAGRLERALAITPGKAWRFEGEMREIAESFRAAGLAPDFHQAAAEVFQRLAAFKDSEAPDLDAVMAALLQDATKLSPVNLANAARSRARL